MTELGKGYGLFDDDALELIGSELDERLKEVVVLSPAISSEASDAANRPSRHPFDTLPARLIGSTVDVAYASLDLARTAIKYLASR